MVGCRVDLGQGGSFGGRWKANETIQNQPIVFVHGVSDTAGERMTQAANWFKYERFFLLNMFIDKFEMMILAIKYTYTAIFDNNGFPDVEIYQMFYLCKLIYVKKKKRF